jgi:hypothetical protein
MHAETMVGNEVIKLPVKVHEGVTEADLDMAIELLEDLQALKGLPEMDSVQLNKVLGEMTIYVLNLDQDVKYQKNGGTYGGMP